MPEVKLNSGSDDVELKFASVAGLNPIGVFFIYLTVFWIFYSLVYLRNR